ncbi:c455cfb6-ced2-4438-8d35-b784b42e963b [Thermothielavioides terrestris]|uniref:C455cfb6-ced2-4438-8d35-b784b42e963b n=1 Tax=Thermothielavioides terrestris TaxID=2587410 RepID=A0A3S4AS49_9PEZI|nr:c455cfb6-ced2-4438-8d35-b784b42e963b [Thermothielavioides terrestris]
MVLPLSASAALLAVACSLLVSPSAVLAADLETVLAGQANLTIFRGLVKNHTSIFANLLKDVTVAAPDDNAFRKVGNWGSYNESTVEATLKYHILKQAIAMPSIAKGDSIWASTTLTDESFTNVTGGQQLILTKQPDGRVVFTSGFATRGTVLVEDLKFDNGLVQIIDSVMRVPETLESTARSAYTDLTSFVGALYATNLMSEFAGAKDLTIFAPRNAAFQQLAGAISAMDETTLKRVLRYHIVPGSSSSSSSNLTHYSWDLKNGSTLATAADGGRPLTVTRFTNFVFVNSAEIIQPDILVANGLVHMVDNLLNPDKADARPDVASPTAQSPVFSLVDATATGTAVPTPFASYLPCTANCPTAQPTAGGAAGAAQGDGAGATSSNAGVAPARCTGLAGAGVGIGLAVGAVIAGW